MDQSIERFAGAVSPAEQALSGEVVRAGEVVPFGEQPATVIRVDMTPAQLAHLIERAGHPIVLQGPQGMPAPYVAPAAGGTGHPGINITYPSSAGSGYVHVMPAGLEPLPEVATPREWAPLAAVASIGAFLSGPLVGMLAGSDAGAAGLCFLGFAGGVASFARLLSSDR